MQHIFNYNIPKGNYRVICSKCRKVYAEGQGNLTEAVLAADDFSNICEECFGEVILETNPKDETPKYDKNHQYPNSSNF